MPVPDKLWVTLSRSRFPWEQEALDFVFDRFPAQDTYRAWANFEFIADDGSINEVDLLAACPQGILLIEIKSNPGTLRGDTLSWTWEHEGRRKTVENPLLLAPLSPVRRLASSHSASLCNDHRRRLRRSPMLLRAIFRLHSLQLMAVPRI